ncbi:type II toxin-antitoxin system VapC family toxin [Limnohabitans sp. Rim8]|uniref:type II toxin-antitoxin system VapC family toxin n=1 Tax=Limnohabitans sp. Rim8 TaxID=1100718 RepID=UPI0025D7B1EF|nr:type II toxin-antitoxin system VapC family toxin [Limnohabitans sp. Rim8]
MSVAPVTQPDRPWHVVDSCGWLAFFGGEANAPFFEAALAKPDALIVPALTLCEVGKRMLQERGEDAALEALAVMQKGKVVQLTPTDLFEAAKTAVKHKLSMGDAIIWQTAQVHPAVIYTQDAGLRHMPHVLFKAK